MYPWEPSRIDEVLNPLRMAAVFCLTLGLGSLAYAVDAARASYTIQFWIFWVIVVSSAALIPYLASIGAQAMVGRFPLLGVRTAAAGSIGLTASVGVAIV